MITPLVINCLRSRCPPGSHPGTRSKVQFETRTGARVGNTRKCSIQGSCAQSVFGYKPFSLQEGRGLETVQEDSVDWYRFPPANKSR